MDGIPNTVTKCQTVRHLEDMESRQFSIGFKSIRIVFFERGLSSASSNQIEQMFQQTEQRKPLSPFQTPSPFHSRLKELKIFCIGIEGLLLLQNSGLVYF